MSEGQRPNIVVLDGYTLNPGDLSWDGLEALGDSVTIYDRTPRDEILDRASEAEVLFTNKTPLSAETIHELSDLKYIGVLATGYNVVDIDAARTRGVPVTNIPSYGTQSVAQMVFAHILNYTQRVSHHAQTVRDGRWARSQDFCYWDYPLIELEGLTMGIIGIGRIGRATAELALAFGMNVIAYNARPPENLPERIAMMTLDEVLATSDFVSLHCPLFPATHHLVNAERLRLMKPTAFLVNTSRGPLIDETALYQALKDGEIAGAALDVLEEEPPAPDNPLYQLENCFITPHISWATHSARSRLLNTAVENLRAFLDDKPINVVNP